jgi:Ca-activated chloride channel family protein
VDNPWALVLLVGAGLAAWAGFHLRTRRAATLSFSRVDDLRRQRRGLVAWLAGLPAALRVLALGLVAIALARPQIIQKEEIDLDGIDVMVVLDMSKSMEERDLQPYRMEAALRTVREFLRGRKTDRIGLVVFAKQAMLKCPLTLDYSVLDAMVSELAIGEVDPMGTAIGDAVGLAVASLKRSDAKSKAIVLVTDGDSNVINEMSPDESVALTKRLGIRVFSVLVGEEATSSQEDFGRRQYGTNPVLLKAFAKETGGKYFHAGDSRALELGFNEVRETLEKSKRKEVRRIPTELYGWFVAPALALVLLEVLLGLTRLRRFP